MKKTLLSCATILSTMFMGLAFADGPGYEETASSNHKKAETHAIASESSNYYAGMQYNVPITTYTDLYGGKRAMKQKFPNMDAYIGTKLGDYFRVEFAPGYRTFKYKSTLVSSSDTSIYEIKKLDMYKFMFNGYIDAPKMADVFTPYAMFGMGYAKFNKKTLNLTLNGNIINAKTSGNNFAWHTGLGVNTSLSNNLSLDVGLIYADYGKVKFSNGVALDSSGTKLIQSTKLRNLEALVGLKYHF